MKVIPVGCYPSLTSHQRGPLPTCGFLPPLPCFSVRRRPSHPHNHSNTPHSTLFHTHMHLGAERPPLRPQLDFAFGKIFVSRGLRSGRSDNSEYVNLPLSTAVRAGSALPLHAISIISEQYLRASRPCYCKTNRTIPHTGLRRKPCGRTLLTSRNC